MKTSNRIKRHYKIRKKIIGTSNKPRLSVFRSNQHICAQIIDDTKAQTLTFASDITLSGTKLQKAYNVGKTLASTAKKLKITNVIFDRGGFLYKGRVAELGRGAREGGLKF